MHALKLNNNERILETKYHTTIREGRFSVTKITGIHVIINLVIKVGMDSLVVFIILVMILYVIIILL